MPQCKKCRKELVWPQPYKKGDRPCEPDGKNTIHTCNSIRQSCGLCPKGRVSGSQSAIMAHKKFYHPNNERIELPEYEWRFQNRYIPYKIRHPHKKKDLYGAKSINSPFWDAMD